MARQPNTRQPDPFSALRGSNRTSSSRALKAHELTQTNISRVRKCNCTLPYADEFKKHYLFYDSYTGAQAWKKIGGNIDEEYGTNGPNGTQNSCAARVSYGLNYSGKLIKSNSPGANRNFLDSKRYIISARKMREYLRQIAGKPNFTLTSVDDFDKLKSALTHDDVFIMVATEHATVVTMNYQDDYARSYLGDVWLLPTRKCNCG